MRFPFFVALLSVPGILSLACGGGGAAAAAPVPAASSDAAVPDGGGAVVEPADTAAPVRPVDDLGARAERIRAKYKLPSLAAAVFDSAGMMAVGAAGVRKVGDATVVTTADKWHLGSNTKAMTATLIARLVDQKKVKWETTLAEAYPALPLHEGYRGVTVEQLLAHRGGVPARPIGMQDELYKKWSESQGPRAAAVAKFLGEPPASTNGSWAYSNAGYMAAFSWLETSENTWEQQLASQLFEPLGMSGCGVGMPATAGQVDQPWGHEEPTTAGGAYKPVAQGKYADNPRGAGPAGTVHCTLESWGRFLSANLRAGRGDETFLSNASFTRLTTAKPAAVAGEQKDYALGWFGISRSWARGVALNHGGSNTTNMSLAWVAPGIDRAFAVVSNAASDDAEVAEDELIAELIDLYSK